LQQAGSGSGYVTCTPYRLRKGEFGGEQFNKSLQVLPRQDAPAEFGETKGIGDDVIEYIRDAGYEHVTYNVSVVNDHVYFAGDILVHNCDDPHSVKGADSDADREAVIQIMSETVPTRLNKQAESAIIIVMQRVHERDTSGHLLSKELGYEHLMLPMEFESERRCYSIVKPSYIKNPEFVNCVYDKVKHVWLPQSEYSGEIDESTIIQKRYNVDPRKEDGELLDPIRFPRQSVEELKGALSSWGGNYAVAGQLQQRPAPRGGGMFKKDDFQIIDSIAGLKFKAIVRGWDFAGSTSKKSPYSVGVKMAKTFDNRIVILDVNRFKKTPLGLEKELLSTAKRDGKNVVIDFPQDPGQAGKSQKMSFVKLLQGFRVKTSPETGSKEQRAEPLAAQVEGQNVYLLRGDWNDAFINEASLFPNSEFKDQIDAASRAYARLLNWKHVVIGTSAELIVG
jgi:predicted phage terminase large subunit-like protein